MKDIPIIFSGPMVRALFANRKTMTRRLAWRSARKDADAGGVNDRIATPWQRVCPGDRLWVRESLTHVTSDPVTARPCSVHCYTADVPSGMDSSNPYECGYLFADDGAPSLKPKGIPSIHMPRWASRLSLIVTSVKIERLQDISDADILAEGAVSFMSGPTPMFGIKVDGGYEYPGLTPRETFMNLWCTLHGASAWNDNPFVVAPTFRAIKANIDAPEALAA